MLNDQFKHVRGNDWRRGFRQILRGELGHWFASRRWLVQIIIYASLIFPLVLTIMGKPETRILPDGQIVQVDHLKESVEFFNATQGIIGVIGVTLLMEGVILGEKRSGTAAWILSKPVSRSAFLLAKLFGNLIGVFMCIILAQNTIAFLLINKGLNANLLPQDFLAAMLPQTINLLFYMSLTTMLAAVSEKRALVIAIPILPLFFDEVLMASVPPGTFNALAKILPFSLATGFGDQMPALARSLMLGVEPFSIAPIFWTLLYILIFIGIGLAAFRRQQF